MSPTRRGIARTARAVGSGAPCGVPARAGAVVGGLLALLVAVAASARIDERPIAAASGDHVFAVLEIEDGVRPGRRIPVLVHHARDLVREGLGAGYRPLAPTGRIPDALVATGPRAWLLFERANDAGRIVSRELFTCAVRRHGLHDVWYGLPRNRIETVGDAGTEGRRLDLAIVGGVPRVLVAEPGAAGIEVLRLLEPAAGAVARARSDAQMRSAATTDSDEPAAGDAAPLPPPVETGPIVAAALRETAAGDRVLLVQRRRGDGAAAPGPIRVWTLDRGTSAWRRRADVPGPRPPDAARAVVAGDRVLLPRRTADAVEVLALRVPMRSGAAGDGGAGWSGLDPITHPGGPARLIAIDDAAALLALREPDLPVLAAAGRSLVPVPRQQVDTAAPIRGPVILSILVFAAVMVAILWPAPPPPVAERDGDPPPRPRGDRLAAGPRAAAGILDYAVSAGLALAIVGAGPVAALVATVVPGPAAAAWPLAAALHAAIGFAGEAATGRTPGKAIFGGVVRRAGGGRPTLRGLAVRAMFRGAMALVPPLGLVAVVRRSMRPVHDVLAGTEVLDARVIRTGGAVAADREAD